LLIVIFCFPYSYCAFFDFAEINILTVCPFGKVPKIKGKKIFWLLPLSLDPFQGLEKAARGGNGGRRYRSYAPGRLGLQEVRTAADTGGEASARKR
jgi:hypothetical protein